MKKITRRSLFALPMALPAALRDRMWLTHYPDDFDLDASVIEPLVQGRTYSI